jgi:integrase
MDNASASFADGTRKVYGAHWRIFLKWCAGMKFDPLPTTPETLARYATWLANNKRKWSTISVAMTTVNQANVTSGHPDVRSAGLVQRVLRGIRRKLHVAPDQAAPFLGEHLKSGVAAFKPQTLMGLRDIAMLSCGFFGAFRRSELVGLNRGDFTLDSKGWIITLRKSKTDQEGRGRKVGLPYASNPAICPVRTVQAWFHAMDQAHPEVTPETPAFLRIDNLHNKMLTERLTSQVLTRIVKQAAEQAGLDPADFSAHSLRAGFVTSAVRAGKSVHAIRRQTGHNSLSMIDRYVRDATVFDDNAAIGLGL